LILLLIGISFAARIPARLIGNLAWLSFARVVLTEEVNPTLYAQTTNRIAVALGLDPGLARLPAAQRWFEGYQVRAVSAQQNRAAQTGIEAAILSLQAPGMLSSEEESRLRELAFQKDDIEAWLVLAYAYENRDDSISLRQILDHLDVRVPQQPIGNSFTFGNWRLEGYDWLPLSADLYEQTRIVLYWRALTASLTSFNLRAGTYQWGDRLFQVVSARNLIPNGNMEWTLVNQIVPLPYPWHLAFHDAGLRSSAAELVSDERSTSNSILRLKNTYGETILYNLLHLKAGATYLLIGQVRTPTSGIYMVMENVRGTNWYPLLFQCSSNNNWRSYAGVFSPVEAQYVGTYLGVSGDPSVTAEYDNLGVFEVKLPQ
jgi:hypothetical protein